MSRVRFYLCHTFLLGIPREILPKRPVEVVFQREEQRMRQPQQLVAEVQGRLVKPQALLEVLIGTKTGNGWLK